MDKEQYKALIEAEGQTWGSAARDMTRTVRPDWDDMQRTPHYAVLDKPHIERLLALVRPGWRVLEIGCSSGWLSLEMARRGGHVLGIDVAAEAIAIARDYAAQHPPAKGSVEYAVLDINYAPLGANCYDLIVAVGVLHHLVEVCAVLERIRTALKPEGLLYVGDTLDTPRANALIAGALMMILPTHLSYGEKLRHLLRLRGKALAHVKDSIEAKGLSPFEGYGRQHEPLAVIKELFEVTELRTDSAFTGYVIAQLRLPRRMIIAVGRAMRIFDAALIRLGVLHGLAYRLVARSRKP